MNHLDGDLLGHVFPGSAFLLLAYFWTSRLFQAGGSVLLDPFSTQPDPRLGAGQLSRAASFEAWGKIVLPIAVIFGELRWVDLPMSDRSLSNYQHITACAGFVIAGVVDLLAARDRMTVGAQRVTTALALLVIGFVFGLHGHHMVVPVAIHRLLAGAFSLAGLCIVLELFRPAPLLRWASIYFVALAGTWFIHAGWQLYIASYDLHSDMVVMRTHLFFTWHVFGVAVTLLSLMTVARRRALSQTQ